MTLLKTLKHFLGMPTTNRFGSKNLDARDVSCSNILDSINMPMSPHWPRQDPGQGVLGKVAHINTLLGIGLLNRASWKSP